MHPKVVDAIDLFDGYAEIDSTFRDKLNAALDRAAGLTITVRSTSNLTVTIEVNSKQLRAGSFWLKHGDVDAEEIALAIADLIVNDAIAALMRQLDMSVTHMYLLPLFYSVVCHLTAPYVGVVSGTKSVNEDLGMRNNPV